MPDDAGFNIPIQSSFSPEGTDAAAAGLNKVAAAGQAADKPVEAPVSAPGAEAVSGKLHELTGEADEFIKVLKAGATLEVGAKLAEGILEVGGALKEAVQEGIRYNQELETLGIGLAAALKQSEPEKYDSFNDALKTSGELLDVVKAKALELNVSTTGLAHTLQVTMLALSEGGIKDLNAQVETTGLLMQAAAAKGVQGFQAVRDIIDILNGQATRVPLAKELGLTNEDIAQAKQTGTLAEYITGKLGAYRDAAVAVGDSLAGLEQRFENLTDALKGEVTAPVFDALKDGLRELDDSLSKPDVADGLRAIGFEVAGLVHTGADLLNFAVQNAGALSVLAQGTAAWGAAVAAVKIKDLVLGLAAKVLRTREDATATAEDTVATEANTRAKLANAEAAAAQGKAGGAGAAGAGLGLAGALNVGLLAGTALAAVITEVAANIDAATARENAFGAAVEKANKSLIEQVRNAKTPADQDAARLAAQQHLVDAALALSHATGETREGLEAQYRTALLLLENFGQQVGTAQKVTEAQKLATAETQKQVQVNTELARVQGQVADAQAKMANITNPGARGRAQEGLDNLIRQRDELEKASLLQTALVGAAIGRAVAEGQVSQALKASSAELDKQSEQDRSKVDQARDYAAALDEVTRRITQDTGLRKDEVEAIHSANDAEQAGLRIGKEKADVLAGYIPSLIDARNALDKANDAATKEQSKLVDKIDAEKDGLGQINQRLEDQRAKLADIATKRKDVENGTVSVRDKQERLTQLAQQEKDARENINRLLDTQKQKTADLAADEAKRKAANEAAHPEETKRIAQNQAYLDATKLTPDHPEHSPEEIADRARAQQYIAQDTATRDGTPPPPAPSTRPVHDLADPSDPYNSTFHDQTPNTPLPKNFDSGPGFDDGGAGNTATAASNLDEATAKASEAAGKLADATSKLSPALDDVKSKLDDHSKAYRDGLQRISDGLTQNVSDLADVVDGNTAEIGSLKSTIFQMQIRLNNVANMM